MVNDETFEEMVNPETWERSLRKKNRIKWSNRMEQKKRLSEIVPQDNMDMWGKKRSG